MNAKSEKKFDLGKNVVDQVAETAIASQIKSAKNIKVDIDSQASGLIQGQVKSLEIACEKIIAFEDISLEQLNVSSDNFSLDLTQAILGKVFFEQAGNFAVKVTFTEADCDRLLNSQYVKTLLQNLILEIDSQPASFYIEQAYCKLQAEEVVGLCAELILNSQGETKTAGFKIELQFERASASIRFKGGKYLGDRSLDLDETVAIMNKISDLLYLRHFHNADLTVEIVNIEIIANQLVLELNTQIKHIPDSIERSLESVADKINNEN